MKPTALFLLRMGLGITFLAIGLMIFNDPEGWGTLIQPWIRDMIPFPIREMMLATAGFDVAIGILLIFRIWTWLAALLGGLHILSVILTTGITEVTIRDVGLIAASLALFIETAPKEWKLFAK